MGCDRCEKLPNLFLGASDIYISLPSHHHIDIFEEALDKNTYTYEKIDDGYRIKNTIFNDFITFLHTLNLNTVEQKDVKIVPVHADEPLSFSSLKNYRNLIDWAILLEGRDVCDIIGAARIRTLFQPIVDIKTGDIYGYEALSRGILKDGSIMNPEKLFSKSKEMDLLFYLDRLCREACIRAASKQKIEKKIFINFIPTSIYEPSLCLETTEKVLKEEKIDPKQVVFEVVETEYVQDMKHLNFILDYYRNKGFSTALDDIGSGYANIEMLLNLKPDYMKIDMNIIRDIHLNLDNQEKLDNFIFYGKKLGVKVLAEGVETADEFAYLQTKDIDYIQGYLFGKPQEVPATHVLWP